MTQHQITQERWQAMTIAERLANIGSEILHRMTILSDKGDTKGKDFSVERVLELISLSLSIEHNKSRLKELARLREVFLALVLGCHEYNISSDMLDEYFLPFALVSRR